MVSLLRSCPILLTSASVVLLTVYLLCDTKSSASTSKAAEVHVEMRNVAYHYTDTISIRIQSLEGSLTPTEPGRVPVFDDTKSFDIAVVNARVFITADSMAHVLNEYVLARKDAPVKHVSIKTKGNSLILSGRKGALPFEAVATLRVTPEGEILLQTEKVRVAHVPVKGLMEVLGVEIADLINTKRIQGIRADGDNLILDTEKVLPPPHIRGRISSVAVQGDEIVQTIGAGKAVQNMAGNYMAYRGGSIGFGKLTMAETDLTLIDMDAKDPFDFYFNRYKDQLVAGYSKTTNNFGLRVYMRDFNKLPAEKRATAGQ